MCQSTLFFDAFQTKLQTINRWGLFRHKALPYKQESDLQSNFRKWRCSQSLTQLCGGRVCRQNVPSTEIVIKHQLVTAATKWECLTFQACQQCAP